MQTITPFVVSALFLVGASLITPTLTSNQEASIASAQTAASGFTFVQDEVTVLEGGTARITIKAPENLARTTRVRLVFRPQTAKSGTDFRLPLSQTITFYRGGLTQKSVTFRTTTDSIPDGDKTLTVSLQGSSESLPVTIIDKQSTSQTTRPPVNTKPNDTGTGIITGGQGTTQTSTTTAQAPLNCAQYSGVLPGETRKLSVVQRSFAVFSLPGVDQVGLTRISQDLAGQFRFDPSQQVARLNFEPGQIQAWRFTTGEYNFPFWNELSSAYHPGSGEANMFVSVSQCPGDFTSSYIPTNCLSTNVATIGMTIGYPGSQFACSLEQNKTYYLNISSGFARQSLDIVTYAGGTDRGFFGYKSSASAPIKLMKGLDSTYESFFTTWSQLRADLIRRGQGYLSPGQWR